MLGVGSVWIGSVAGQDQQRELSIIGFVKEFVIVPPVPRPGAVCDV